MSLTIRRGPINPLKALYPTYPISPKHLPRKLGRPWARPEIGLVGIDPKAFFRTLSPSVMSRHSDIATYGHSDIDTSRGDATSCQDIKTSA